MSPRARILSPYTARIDDWRHRVERMFVYLLFVGIAVVIGFLTAILPTSFLIIPMLPIIVLFFLVLWLAPDVDPEIDRLFRILFLFTIGASLLWPHYVAYRAPGVGLVTPTRISLYAMTFLFLYAMASSARLRGVLGDALGRAPVIKWSFIGFVTIQALLAVAWLEFGSRWINVQTYWYLMVVMAVIAASYEKVPRGFGILMAIGGVWCAVFVIWEWTQEYKVWMLWIPPVFQGDAETWAKIIDGARRHAIAGYRASGIITNPVTMGEFIGLTTPFIIYATARVLTGWWRLLILPVIPLYGLAVVATGSRTAFITITVAVGAYLGLWAWRRYRRGESARDLLGPAAVWSYPFGAVLGIAVIFSWNRAYRAFIGGGHTAPSDNARLGMWERTFDRLLQNPFGYGPNQVGRLIGKVKETTGGVTVDGYFMNMLIDFGVLGFLCWFLLFAGALWYAVRVYLNSGTRDEDVAGPIAVSLLCFLVSKGVLSQSDNHHLMFAMVGVTAALVWRQSQRLAITATERRPAPAVRPQPLPPRRPLAGLPRPGLALRG
jgi:hypothetical protein